MPTNHSPLPWTTRDGVVFDASGLSVASIEDHVPADQEAETVDLFKENAARIVACVNACEQINPDAVPDMLGALIGLNAIRPQCAGDEWVTLEIRRTQLTAMQDAVRKALGKAEG